MPELAHRMWSLLEEPDLTAAALRDPVVVLPLAATEQHGPHLPLTTDLDIGAGLLEVAFRRLPDGIEAWALPPLAVGASEEHTSFTGTQSLSTEDLVAVVCERGAALAAQGVRRLVLSNSHGGNRHAMEVAGLRLRRAHRMLVVKASYFRFDRPDGVELPEREWRLGLHGGAVETAMMMHLKPQSVRDDAVADFPSLAAELEATLRRVRPEGQASFSWLAEDLNPQGVVGDATFASAELGARLLDHYGSALAEVIEDAASFPLDRLGS